MTSEFPGPDGAARVRARGAMARAHAAERRAERYEGLARDASASIRSLYVDLAAGQRRMAERHRASARIQYAFAQRLAESRRRIDGVAATGLVHAVADALGVESAAVLLQSSCHGDATAVSSDARAQEVQDAELVLAEGPSHHVTRSGAAVEVGATEIDTRWPRFAEAVAALELRHVAAVPLSAGGSTVGALTVLDPPWRSATAGLVQLVAVGEALIDTVIDDLRGASWTLDRAPIVDGDRMPLLHMAAGMVAARRRCSPADAIALIQAHAYARNISTGKVALDITEGRLDLAD